MDPAEAYESFSLTQGEITRQAKELHLQGQDLNAAAMLQGNTALRRLYRQGNRRFDNGWDDVLTLIGLDPDEIRLHRKPYTKEELAGKIKELEASGVSLRAGDIQNDEGHCKYYSAAMYRYDSWREFLDDAGVDSSRYVDRTDWDSGEGVMSYLRDNFDSGIVTGASNNKNFAAAAQKYFGTLPEAVKRAGLFYSRSGRITRKMLQDPDTVGALYKHNADFLGQIAKKVYFGLRIRKARSFELDDFRSQAFMRFLEILPKKPSKVGIRQFCYRDIYHHLLDFNRQQFREVTFGDEVFLDLASRGELKRK